MPDPDPKPQQWCSSYHAGHNVHWIHARKASETERFVVTAIEVTDDRVTLTANGETLTMWCHNIRHVERFLAARADATTAYCPRWKVLYIETEPARLGHGRSSAMFYLATEPSDCIGGVAAAPLGEVRVHDDTPEVDA